MNQTFSIRQVGDVIIVDAEGRITVGGSATALRDTVRDLAAKVKRKWSSTWLTSSTIVGVLGTLAQRPARANCYNLKNAAKP